MRRKIILILLIFGLVLAVGRPGTAWGLPVSKVYLPVILRSQTIAAPVLKWQYGGCYTSWCELGWYSSPAVADVDEDGDNDVVASAYSLATLDGQTGALIWRALSTNWRTWPGVAVADIDLDGADEIVVAQGGGWVTVVRLDNSIKWQYRVDGGNGELRSMLVADLDGNGSTLEVVVSRAYNNITNTWVLNANGVVRSGWPQMQDSANGYSWGVYNANAAAGNIDGDSPLELIVPSDVHFINALNPDGSSIPANTTVYPGMNYWGRVGVWESLATELRGWGYCDGVRAESYRANFADGPAVIADLNGDGGREIAAVGNMYDCDAGYPPSRYLALFIFNPDRTRFN